MAKTQCLLETWQSKPKKYVLDTCIGRRCYDNYAYCDMLKTKVSDLPTSTVVFTSVSVYEIDKRVECGFGELYLQLKSDINSEITIQKITYNMKKLGIWLCNNISGLHSPDNEILAYAMLTNSVLITCDKGLEEAAKSVSQDVINPDHIITEYTKIRNDFSKLAQDKVNQITQKIPIRVPTTKDSFLEILVKSGKITWETFA